MGMENLILSAQALICPLLLVTASIQRANSELPSVRERRKTRPVFELPPRVKRGRGAEGQRVKQRAAGSHETPSPRHRGRDLKLNPALPAPEERMDDGYSHVA